MAKLTYIEGVGEAYAQNLKASGISTTKTLLEVGSTSKGRKHIAAKSSISDSLISK